MSTACPRPVRSRANSASVIPCAANMPDDDVGDGDAEAVRRSVAGAGDAHQPAFGLHHGVIAGSRRRGPVWPKPEIEQ